jgi:hypothetical protein
LAGCLSEMTQARSTNLLTPQVVGHTDGNFTEQRHLSLLSEVAIAQRTRQPICHCSANLPPPACGCAAPCLPIMPTIAATVTSSITMPAAGRSV